VFSRNGDPWSPVPVLALVPTVPVLGRTTKTHSLLTLRPTCAVFGNAAADGEPNGVLVPVPEPAPARAVGAVVAMPAAEEGRLDDSSLTAIRRGKSVRMSWRRFGPLARKWGRADDLTWTGDVNVMRSLARRSEALITPRQRDSAFVRKHSDLPFLFARREVCLGHGQVL
jgi:hypothetical protein